MATRVGDWPESVQRQIRRQLSGQSPEVVFGGASRAGKRTAAEQTVNELRNYARSGRRPKHWSAAVPTEVDGRHFPSKTEARVFQRLRLEVAKLLGVRLLRQVRLPLFSVGADEADRPFYLTVDFALQAPGNVDPPRIAGAWVRVGAWWWQWIEAKCRTRRSRDWVRGKAAWEATWGPIQEVDR